jgi:hypothetical protein
MAIICFSRETPREQERDAALRTRRYKAGGGPTLFCPDGAALDNTGVTEILIALVTE